MKQKWIWHVSTGVDSIYYRVSGGLTEIMRVLGRQDVGGRAKQEPEPRH